MAMVSAPLIVAAAGVGFGHAILPDHWLPLAVVGRTQGYPLGRVARLSGLAGVAHVLVSMLLGGAVIAIGLQFRSSVEHAQSAIVGGLLIATGAGFLALELTGRGHRHPDHHGPKGIRSPDDHVADPGAGGPATHPGAGLGRGRQLAAIMVPFGAAASPDLTILPVFLAAAAVGAGTALGSLIVFAAVTIATIIALTLLATYGGYQLEGRWLERWGNAITAGVLAVIGALVLTSTI